MGEGYWLMPNAVLFNKELTDKQKLLYCLISSLCAEKGYCRASNDYLGSKLGAARITISKNIAVLQEMGLVFVEVSPEQWNKRKLTIFKKEYTYIIYIPESQ